MQADILKLDSTGNTAPGTDVPSTTFITQNDIDGHGSQSKLAFELPAIASTTSKTA